MKLININMNKNNKLDDNKIKFENVFIKRKEKFEKLKNFKIQRIKN